MVTIIKKGMRRKEIQSLLKGSFKKKTVEIKKYCGVIKLQADALELQKQSRNEWQ